MPTIRQLPQGLINKIAAGEVIERPASVVKELMENSIDAGATRIELTIEGGGIDLIRISDNGCGIAEEQLPLAVASHATSKLQDADDLFDVHTLGFRGEALASIAEISHLTVRTRVAEADSGAELSVRGGEKTAIVPTGCPVGTIIEVRNLFFNTPVRRNFLRTPQTEAGHITEAFTRIALAFPQVAFVMRSGNRVTHDLPATDAWQQRIEAFFGEEIGSSLIRVNSSQDEANLAGFVADPTITRSNNRMQYIFLNGRHIKDRSLQHALGEAYRGLMMVGRYPVCFLRLDIPPDKVDVNVHPTKMEVRFQESGKLYSQLLKTLRHEFLTTDLTARARHVPGPVPKGLREAAGDRTSDQTRESEVVVAPDTSVDAGRWEDHANQVTAVSQTSNLGKQSDETLGLTANVPDFRPFPNRGGSSLGITDLPPVPRPASENSSAQDTAQDTEASQLPPGAEVWGLGDSEQRAESAGDHSKEQSAENRASIQRIDAADASLPRSHLGFQVHNRYLITQDENGMVIVDQHALHERIIYQQLREKAQSRELESQRLLVPEPLDLTPSEASAAVEHQEVLKEIGIEIEPFGGDTILMTSYPAILARMRPAEVMRQVLEPLMSGGKAPDARDLIDEILNMLACKAAVKAGDKLSGEEITALLEQKEVYQDTHHCPHGRPTALFFSREQLDKMFKRT
ncbi:MAG TPA: DNA mismatch repair endonuclease MutL [Planctomycetaceae bacterium]|nr:DNA mismatch repair endonuclease MutL [Planctomycetaceae bacterium]